MLRRVLVALVVLAVVLLLMRSAPTPPPSSSVVGAMGHGRTVVLVHGLGSDANDWLPVARDLARDHRVVLVELPGQRHRTRGPAILVRDGRTAAHLLDGLGLALPEELGQG